MEHKFISVFILVIAFQFTSADKVCNSIDIKNEKDLETLKDCTAVDGYVRLSNFRIFEVNASLIASNLEEVTDYLMVYRVDGLKSLEQIFPNLTIIRGHELLFDKYSLVVYENRDLRDIGLKSLLKIRKGSIQVESNPVLCFADTVNWVYLLEDHRQQHYSLKNNRDINECPLCLKKTKNSETEYLKAGCWNLKNFQRKKPIPHLSDCPHECGANSCTPDRKCCSPLCLTGCHSQNCRICKHFKNLEGNCIESCSIQNYTLADKCITDKECRRIGRIPHAGVCRSECPRSYKQVEINGIVKCNLLCNQNFVIRFKDDLEDLRDCVIIRGSLHIELKDDRSKIVEHLENALGGVKEITGHLKITKSHQLVSLGFFKKLDTIKGDDLINNEIAFYLVDNFHLEEIWPENHKVAILKGRIFIHLNPRLCFEKILQLQPSIRSHDDFHVKDASLNSNGERVICGSKVRLIYPVVEDVNATAARIKVDPLSSSDKEVVLGYFHYYKEAPIRNVTMFDGRHGCGHDDWHMDLTLDRNIRHLFTNLKPFTQYAFFVKTMTMLDYHMQVEWCSSIQYFKTLAMKPGPVKKMYATTIATTAVIVHWWPPANPNGIISRYILRHEPVDEHIDRSQAIGYNATSIKDKDCECGIERKPRGPPPNDLTYYNRDQIVVDEAIPNLIFVSIDTIRRIEEERRIEDLTRRRRRREAIESSSEGTNVIVVTTVKDTESKKDLLTAEEQENIDAEKAIEIKFKQHLEEIERQSLQQQDTGIEGFKVIHAKPICSITFPTEQYQKDNGCIAKESYEGTEIPPTLHSLPLEDLRPDTVYRISIRACVDGLENPCGPERSIDVETVNPSMEFFLKGP